MRPSGESDTNRQLWSQLPALRLCTGTFSVLLWCSPHYWVLVESSPHGILLGQALSGGPFSGACVESPAGPWNHKNPFPVPVLVPAPGPPQTRLCPHKNYPPPPTPSSHPRCFQPSFQNSMPSLLRPGWLFSPSCLEYSGILCSSKVEKRRSSPPYVYLFLNSDNHPAGGFLTEERRCILETDRLEPCLCDLW